MTVLRVNKIADEACVRVDTGRAFCARLNGGGPAASADVQDWQAVVLKVEVVRLDGAREIGSGSCLATGRHQLPRAVRGILDPGGRGAAVWAASMDAGDEYRDLCFLRVPGFSGLPPPIAEPDSVRMPGRAMRRQADARVLNSRSSDLH